MLRCISGLAASPISRPFISMARKMAMQQSSRPMAREPSASQRPLPVIAAMVTPKRANMRPTSAPESSSRTTGSSGDFVRRRKGHQLSLPRRWLASLTAVRNE